MLGISGKVTRRGQNRNFPGPHLCKWSVRLFKVTKHRILAACEIGMHSFMERLVNMGRPTLGTKWIWPSRAAETSDQSCLSQGGPFGCRNGNKWYKVLEPLPLVCSLGAPVNKLLVRQPGGGGFAHLSDTLNTWCNTDFWEEMPSLPLFEMGKCGTQDWSLCLEQRLHSALSDENDSSAHAFSVLTWMEEKCWWSPLT